MVSIAGRGMRRKILFVLLTLLAGCSTPYQEMGFSGGVAAEQMTTDTFRIIARGNGYTKSTTVQDYVMLKAAETAVHSGGTHFVLLSAADATRTSQIVSSGVARTTFVGNHATTTYDPPDVTTFYKPGQDTYIRILKVPPNETAPQGAVSAEEIIKFVGNRVHTQ